MGMAVALALACEPVLVERDGHRVFNPQYLPVLESSFRDRWQHPEAVLDALDVPADAVVADVGAGGGYFTERFSKRVPQGHVYATDVQEPMLSALRRRVEKRRLTNVSVVRGEFDDPGLGAACCDLVFLSSVYHEIDDRVDYMRRVRLLLRPGGRVAILEFEPGAGGPGPPDAARLAPERVEAELEAAGFVRTASHDVVPRESMQIFEPTGPRVPRP
jgi:ubiquinone/menaquinone biosynthesis C-methylase UbiE